MESPKKRIKDLDDNPFKQELLELMAITNGLKKRGLLILLTLMSSIVLLAIYAMITRELGSETYVFSYSTGIVLWVYILLMVILGILLLFQFNNLRNKGMIIYEELTDEIDWSSKRREFIHRPPVQTRIIIKEFLKTSDLPFTSGVNGQAFYLVLLVLILISSIIVKVLL